MSLRCRGFLIETKDSKANKKQAVKLVKNLLLTRRNNSIKGEQMAYNKLRAWCDKNNFNIEDVINGATQELKKSIAASMGGLV